MVEMFIEAGETRFSLIVGASADNPDIGKLIDAGKVSIGPTVEYGDISAVLHEGVLYGAGMANGESPVVFSAFTLDTLPDVEVVDVEEEEEEDEEEDEDGDDEPEGEDEAGADGEDK
jgi:hypothetical protein